MIRIQHERSLWRGALIAPWAAPLTFPLIVAAEYLCTGDGGVSSASDFFSSWMLQIVFGLPFTYIVTAVFVVPIAVWLRKKDALSSIRLCAWCTLLGPVTFAGYAFLLSGRLVGWKDLGKASLLLAFYGLTTGVVFCLSSRVRLVVKTKQIIA